MSLAGFVDQVANRLTQMFESTDIGRARGVRMAIKEGTWQTFGVGAEGDSEQMPFTYRAGHLEEALAPFIRGGVEDDHDINGYNTRLALEEIVEHANSSQTKQNMRNARARVRNLEFEFGQAQDNNPELTRMSLAKYQGLQKDAVFAKAVLDGTYFDCSGPDEELAAS